MEEGVAREASEKEVAKGFIRPSLVFGPCSVKHPTGVAGQEPPFQSRFLASPSPWLVRASFLPELSRSES